MSISFGPNLGLMVNGAAGEGHYSQLMAFLRGVDALVMPVVKDTTLSAPPGSPSDGDCYIIAAAPTGAWSGRATNFARWSSVAAAWEFFTPKEGWRAFSKKAASATYGEYYFNGSAWQQVRTIPPTGWGNPTGTATRTAFATSTVTTAQLAEHVKALIDDLKAHGLITS